MTALQRATAGVARYLPATTSLTVDAIQTAAVRAGQDTWTAITATPSPVWLTRKVAQAVHAVLTPVAKVQTLTDGDATRVIAAARAIPLLHQAHAQDRAAGCPAYISTEAVGEALRLLMEMEDGMDVRGMCEALHRCGQQGNRNVTSVYAAVVRERVAAATPRRGQEVGTVAAGLSVLEARRARRAQTNERNEG